jgi:hypothetical protein
VYISVLFIIISRKEEEEEGRNGELLALPLVG